MASFTAISGQGAAYSWLLKISGLRGFILWAGIAVSHYRFHRGFLTRWLGHRIKTKSTVVALADRDLTGAAELDTEPRTR